ncbi:Molybdopterin adenylyltransferase [Paraconexibacter sp. AEG42_29]|uniref:Molybdopterin adenylyltransferase n=1 Tax=Paraconexibacter sp. AEG42_29 TaxID=2997339 RepID=A0AAU7B3B7_9ACTN
MRTAVLTISTSLAAGQGDDASGPLLAQLATDAGCTVELAEVVTDATAAIAARLRDLVADDFAVILTTGGTGFTPDDHTPEATRAIIERDAPGIAEALRAEGLKHKPHAMLTRGVAGLAGRTLIVNFPGSPKALNETFGVLAAVLPHAVGSLRQDHGRRSTGH